MELKEVLSLNNNVSSVKRIDTFLMHKNVNSHDYSIALNKLADIIFNMGDISLAFSLLFDYLSKCEDIYKLPIFDRLLEFYYYQEDYEQVLSTIKKKEKCMPSYKHSDIYLDYINYFEKIKDETNYIKAINNYLDGDINDNGRLDYLLIITKYYFKENNYHAFKKRNEDLKSLALKNKNDNVYQEALVNEIIIEQKNGDYVDAQDKINDINIDSLNDVLKAKIIDVQLRILVYDLNEYRKASIYESENEKLIDLGDDITKLDFCDTCIFLYQKLESQFSVSSYIDKKNSISLTEIEIKKEIKKTIIPNKLNYSFKFLHQIEEKKIEEKQPDQVEIKAQEEKQYHFDVSLKQDFFVNLNTIFNELDFFNLGFHEYYRSLFTLLNKLLKFEDLYFASKNYQYYFKKERLYKREDDLRDSVFNSKEDLIIEASNHLMITKKEYYPTGYALALINTKRCQYLFSFKQRFSKDDILYHELKMVCLYLELMIEKEDLVFDEKRKRMMFNHLIENQFIGYKVVDELKNVYLSDNLSKMLDVPTTINLAKYYDLISNKDIYHYQEDFNNKNEIIYRFKEHDFYIKEIIDHYENYVQSILIKCSDEMKIVDDLKTDQEVKTYNLPSLKEDIKDFSDDKLVFVLFDYHKYNLYEELYGRDFVFDLNKAIANYLMKNKRFRTYHLDGFKYLLVIFNMVDKRSTYNLIKELDDDITKHIYNINKRVKIDVNYSFIRYPHDVNKLELDEVLNYLYLAQSDEKINCFDKSIIRQRRFEQELVTHISESIDRNQLLIEYQEVVNYKNRNVLYLIPNLNLSNYDVLGDTLDKVIKKRQLDVLMERYIVHKALFELKEINDKHKYYLPILIRISHDTLLDNFSSYLEEQMSFFHIPKEAISLYYDDIVDQDVLNAFKEIDNKKINIVSNRFELLRRFKLKAFVYDHDEYQKLYLEELLAIVRNSDVKFIVSNIKEEKDVASYAILGIEYYFGPLFKHKYLLENLLEKEDVR